MTHYNGRSKQVAEQIVARFERGDIAAPLAVALLSHKGVWMDKWSPMNRFWAIINGCTDARAFGTWKKAGRRVKGKARFYILTPRYGFFSETDEDGEKKTVRYVKAYGTCAVWDVTDTDGDPLPKPDNADHEELLANLPLLDVAEAWGLDVQTVSSHGKGYLGYYQDATKTVATGTKNLGTFLHELVHAADYRNGTKVEKANHPVSEAVAELGSSVLAHALGMPHDADEGGTWRYIKMQAGGCEEKAFKLCRQVINRVAAVCDLILEESEKLNQN